ncbi:MAG: PHP domain-containing protein [Clostridia bacterium]|nr:PHP domain-containing protein [Clostridia bacterium]
MYKYEIHCHTKETSRCGRCPAADMVKAYHQKGFAGVVITDHFVNGYSYSAFPNTWKDKMDAFVKGYNAAKETGDALGMKVYFGFEYTNDGNNGEDYLVIGLTPQNLYDDLVDCDQWTIEELVEKVHALGGIVVRAHPFREDDYIAESCVMRPGLNIDAIEVFNGGNKKEIYNVRALELALKEGKPMVAGSDTHHVNTTASNYIAFEEEPQDYAAFCQAIKDRKAFIVHKQHEEAE